jgi:hypothetical protein
MVARKYQRQRRQRTRQTAVTAALTGRNMFVWQLAPILAVEGGPHAMAQKAVKAQFTAVWIKIAAGQQEYQKNAPYLAGVLDAMGEADVGVWGWHEPRCATLDAAKAEAEKVAELAQKFNVAGILMDAEMASGTNFFQGGVDEATLYASTLQQLLHEQERPLALCSHDIPQNFPDFPFASFAEFADWNVPQVYYGASPSVNNRLERAIKANVDVDSPFVPVGAGWVGGGGGCASDSACAERAVVFIQLVKENSFPAYSFWHWAGAPLKLWNVLMTNELT